MVTKPSDYPKQRTDRRNYLGAATVCPMATAQLKKPSLCLECPFDKCIYEIKETWDGRTAN